MINLELNKEYEIITSSGPYNFKVKNNPCGYYLFFSGHDNDVLFFKYNIDSVEFTTQILGYENGGIWPWCETIEDCKKLLYVLLEEINKKSGCICDLHLLNKNNCNCWDD